MNNIRDRLIALLEAEVERLGRENSRLRSLALTAIVANEKAKAGASDSRAWQIAQRRVDEAAAGLEPPLGRSL